MVFSLTLKIKTLLIFMMILIILISIIIFINTDKHCSYQSYYSTVEFTVVVDPGHGSIDTGTSYNNIYEKDINLSIAKKLAAELKKVNIHAVLTREKDILYENDRNLDIKHRPQVAKDVNADLFISIHANNYPSSQPSGSQIFYKINSDKSKELADYIHEELITLRKVNNRSLKKGDFYVLNNCHCPGVLIETGFLSNAEDRNKLSSEEYQQDIAGAIKTGIVNYLRENLGQKPQNEHTKNHREDLHAVNHPDTDIYQLYFPVIDNDQIELKTQELEQSVLSILHYKNPITSTALNALTALENPPENCFSPLASGTKIKSLTFNQGLLTINFSKELRNNFNGGIYMELLSLKSIVNTILSIPEVERISILINNQENSSIGGHIIIKDEYSSIHDLPPF